MTEAPAAGSDKLDFKRVLPIFVIVLVDLLGLTIIIPLLPLYSVAFGADPLTIGIISASYPTMQLIGAPLLGALSDRYGRKPVLVVSQIGTFIGFVLLGVANALPVLLLSRVIDGLSGANIVTAQAAITDSTNERTRAQGLGLIGAAFGLGFTVGPAIAGIALGLTGNDYRVPAFIAAGFSLLSILLTIFWFKETLPESARGTQQKQQGANIVVKIWQALTNPLLAILLILMFMQQLVFGGFEQLLPLFTLTRLGLDGAGNAVLFVFVGVILVFIQGKYIGPLSRRFGEHRLIHAGLALVGIGLILTAITPQQPVTWYSREAIVQSLTEAGSAQEQDIALDLPADDQNGWLGLIWIMVALVPASIGGGMLSPSINSLITKRAAAGDVGGTLGVSSALVSLANAVTPLIGGSLFQFLGSTAPFLIGGLLLLVLMAFALRGVTSSNQRGAEQLA
jgi:DHA1 family tetracycline resistance protein-like MFS transporter